MCGIVGVVSQDPVNQLIYDALLLLQHRGQDAAGIVTQQGRKFFMHKAKGMVRDVFRTRNMRSLPGNCGLGQVRYPTAGNAFSEEEAQPFYVNSPYGITLAHNGNLTNAEEIHDDLFKTDLRHMNTDSDSEVLLNVFAHELQKRGKLMPTADDIFHVVSKVHERCKGGYAVVAMLTGHGLVGFRDPNGIRPLIYGSRETDAGMEYIIASESVAITALGFKVERDIAPGEAIFIDSQGQMFTKQCAEAPEYRPCIFEYVYFARPDAIIDGISVYKARLKMGEKLAQKILTEWSEEHDIDVVIPIPDTSRTSALELANMLGVKFREGFMKNRYIGRTFIMPGQQLRKKSVRQKLNPVELEFQGKNVLLVDDSIVRGTTCNEIIQMARDAGAKKVFFASAAPMVKYPNVYGIDMPAKEELIASERTVEEIREIIGADRLIFQDLEDLKAAVRTSKVPDLQEFDCSVFDGKYVAGGIDEAYLDELQAKRRETSKKKDSYIDVNIDAASVDLTGVKEV